MGLIFELNHNIVPKAMSYLAGRTNFLELAENVANSYKKSYFQKSLLMVHCRRFMDSANLSFRAINFPVKGFSQVFGSLRTITLQLDSN